MRIKTILILLVLSLIASPASAKTKRADLAGSWYPRSKEALTNMLEGYLESTPLIKTKGKILGFIMPHAGYIYSAPVASFGYKIIENFDRPIETVIIVGFNHRFNHPGIAVCASDSYLTPLGEIPINKYLSKELTDQHKDIYFLNEAFIDENSSEMQIPFIQTVLEDSNLVIIHMGNQTIENSEILADALYTVLKDKDNVILIASTDMCHYLPYDKANETDNFTIEELKKFNPYSLYSANEARGHGLMCGSGPVIATMMVCKKLGANSIEVLKHANSGDVSGDKSRVVGYLSAAITRDEGRGTRDEEDDKGEDMGLTAENKKTLLNIARKTLEEYLSNGKMPEFKVDSPILKENRGSFVTLRKHGQLRGCIGHMVGTDPLYLTVRDMAIEAATGDPRFPKVTYGELKDIAIEISVLSPLKKVSSPDEITLGTHGVIVKRGFRQGVYLPQVATETGWSKEEFLSSLCAHKAGLSPLAWKDGSTELIVFTAEVFSEEELKR